MGRHSISPGKLMKHLMDEDWMAKRRIDWSGKRNRLIVYHDDGCPSATGGGGLLKCTCHVVDYEIRPPW